MTIHGVNFIYLNRLHVLFTLCFMGSLFKLSAQYEGGIGRQDALSSTTVLQLNDGAAAVTSSLVFTVGVGDMFEISQNLNTLTLEYRVANGQRAYFETGNVALTFQTNPGSATLNGTTTQTPNNGVATFTGLSVSALGSGYELLASGASGTSATSTAFTLYTNNAGGSGRQDALSSTAVLQLNDGTTAVTTSLAFTAGPASMFEISQNLNTLTLEYRVANGQQAYFETGNVALTFQTNPGSATLNGTTTQTPNNGVATFTGLSVSALGSGYELLASGASGTSAISAVFTVYSVNAGGSGRQDAMTASSGLGTLSGQVFWVGGLGSIPTDWNDPLNWFPNTAVPDQNARIAIEPNNNGHNPILDQNRTVNSLNFNGANKKVVLGNYTLTLSADATGVNSNNYFKTNGTGSVKRAISNTVSFAFPVGDSTYNPVTITNNTGTSDDFTARVADAVLAGGISGSAISTAKVNRTWHIGKTNPTANAGAGVNMVFSWDPAQEIGNLPPYTLNHHNGNCWQLATSYGGSEVVSGSSPKLLSFTGYRGTFSPFAVAGELIAPQPVVLASSTRCSNTAINPITQITTNATGIGTPIGLPAGVTAAWVSDTIAISGTPTATGTFNYNIPLTGGCNSVNATGTLTITQPSSVGVASGSPVLFVNTAISNITHNTTGATGIGTATGLPAGVTSSWAGNVITISGTPSVPGIFNYTIPLTGGCGSSSATGTISVYANLSTNTVATAQTILLGDNSNTLTGSTITGGSGFYTYQWEQSTNNGNTWTTISGATNTNHAPGSLSATSQFRRVVADAILSGSSTSAPVEIRVVNYTIVANGNTPLVAGQRLTLSALASNPHGTFTWAGPSGFSASGISTIINSVSLQDQGVYMVTQTVDQVTLSDTIHIVIYPALSANLISASQTVLTGTTAQAFTGSVVTGGMGAIQYQWQQSPDGLSNWLSVTGGTQRDYAAGIIQNNVYYRRIVGDGVLVSDTSAVLSIYAQHIVMTVSQPSTVCTGDAMVISVTGNVPGALYQWQGPGGFQHTGDTVRIVPVGLVHAGQYTVSLNHNSIQVDRTIQINVLDPYANITAGSNSPVCAGSHVQFSATNQTGISYVWRGPNQFQSGSRNALYPNASTSASGIYSLTVTDGVCAARVFTTSVSVNSSALSLQTNEPVCEGSTMHLTAQGSVNAQYVWRGPQGFTSTGATLQLSSAQISQGGIYHVTSQIPGCGVRVDSVLFRVGTSPLQIGAGTNAPVCSGSTLLITAGSSVGISYAWSGPNGFSSTQTQLTFGNAVASDSGTYVLTMSSPGCATRSLSIHAPVNTISMVRALNSGPVCLGDSLVLTAQSPFNSTFVWQGPNGFQGSGSRVVLSNGVPQMTGVYSLYSDIPGCGNVLSLTSAAVNVPASVLTPTSNSPLCSAMSLQFSVESYSGATYLWTAPAGYTSSIRSGSFSRIDTTYRGVYSLQVHVAGCGTYTAVSDTVIVNHSAGAGAYTPAPVICEGGAVYLYSQLPTGVSQVMWYGPDGFTSSIRDVGRSNATTSMSGVYTFVASFPGCGPVYDFVSVSVTPRVPFNFAASTNSPICAGGTLQLSADDYSDVNYLWTGPNGFSSTARMVSLGNATIGMAGAYQVALTRPGCPVRVQGLSVLVNDLGLQTISTNSPVCVGGVLTFDINSTTGVSYTWSGPSGFSATGAHVSIANVGTQYSGLFTLVSIAPGCGRTEQYVNVQVNAPYPLNTDFWSNSPICSGEDLILSVSAWPNTLYQWQGPNGLSSNQAIGIFRQADISYSGLYSLHIQVPGCMGARGSVIQAVVNSLQSPIQVSSNSPQCQGGVIYLQADGIPSGSQISWQGPNGFTSNLASPSLVNVQTIQTGTYSLSVAVPGCPARIIGTPVLVSTSIINLTIQGNATVCVGSALSLSTQLVGGAIYSWQGPSGFTASGVSFLIPSANSSRAGVYTLNIVQAGCGTRSITRSVTVHNVQPPVVSTDRSAYCSGQHIYFSSTSVSGATSYNWTGPAGYVAVGQWPARTNSNITHTGEYSLQVVTQQCGILSSSVQVVVGSPINNTQATANTPVCLGGTLLLQSNISESPGVVHNWIAPNGNTYGTRNVSIPGINMSYAGNYTYTVVSPGCGTATRNRRVAVSDASLVTASSNGPVCTRQTVFFTGTGPAGTTYSWQGPGGYMASTQFPARSNAQLSHAGVYTLNANVPGCGIISTTTTLVVNVCRFTEDSASVDAELPAENQLLLSGIEVYPNPFSEKIQVSWGDLQVFSIRMYDVQGQLISTQYPEETHVVEFDGADLPSGVYMLHLQTSAGPATFRVIRM